MRPTVLGAAGTRSRAVFLAFVVLVAARPAAASVGDRIELGIDAALYHPLTGQDLGDQALGLTYLRADVLATPLPGAVLRAAFFVLPVLSVGLAADVHAGPIDGRAVLLLRYRADVTFVPWARARLSPFISVSGGGQSLFSSSRFLGRDTDPIAGYAAGLSVRVSPRLRLTARFIHLFAEGLAPTSLAHTIGGAVGVAMRLGPSPALATGSPLHDRALDSDGDGLVDAVDRCPRASEDPDGFADDDGCPEPGGPMR